MVVVIYLFVMIYFGGRGTLWAIRKRIGRREYMHQFHGHFSGPGKHIFCTYFMENILSGIVQHVLKSNVNFLRFIL